MEVERSHEGSKGQHLWHGSKEAGLLGHFGLHAGHEVACLASPVEAHDRGEQALKTPTRMPEPHFEP